jgi:hypothetical protein
MRQSVVVSPKTLPCIKSILLVEHVIILSIYLIINIIILYKIIIRACIILNVRFTHITHIKHRREIFLDNHPIGFNARIYIFLKFPTNISGNGSGITGLTAAQIPALATSKITGLDTALTGKQNTINSTAGQLIIGNGNGLTTTNTGLTFNSTTSTLTATNINATDKVGV